MWPWLLGGAILLVAAATGSNKSSIGASEYRSFKRREDSEKVIKTMLNEHHERLSQRQQELLEAENSLLENKNDQDHRNLKALLKRLAKATSKSEKHSLKQQIKFYNTNRI